MLKISEFQTKDVVNILDGRKLGSVCDLELDLHQGKVQAIVCPGSGKFFGLFSGSQDIVIPWKNIVKIGADVILVRLEDQDYLEERKDALNRDRDPKPPVYRPYAEDNR